MPVLEVTRTQLASAVTCRCTVTPGGVGGVVVAGAVVLGAVLLGVALVAALGVPVLAGAVATAVPPASGGVPRSARRPTTQLTASSTTTSASTAMAAAGHLGADFVALRVISRTGSPMVLNGATVSLGSCRPYRRSKSATSPSASAPTTCAMERMWPRAYTSPPHRSYSSLSIARTSVDRIRVAAATTSTDSLARSRLAARAAPGVCVPDVCAPGLRAAVGSPAGCDPSRWTSSVTMWPSGASWRTNHYGKWPATQSTEHRHARTKRDHTFTP